MNLPNYFCPTKNIVGDFGILLAEIIRPMRRNDVEILAGVGVSGESVSASHYPGCPGSWRGFGNSFPRHRASIRLKER